MQAATAREAADKDAFLAKHGATIDDLQVDTLLGQGRWMRRANSCVPLAVNMMMDWGRDDELCLSTGSFGSVFLGKRSRAEPAQAIKILDSSTHPSRIVNEVQIMKMLRCVAAGK